MKLFFFSVTKHQYRYFEQIKNTLGYESKHLFFPNMIFSLSGFRFAFTLDLEEIFQFKYKEIDQKYHNPIIKTLYKTLLKLQAPFVVASLYPLLLAQKPDILFLWNGKKLYQAIADKVAKALEIKTVYFENGVLPNTTTMDFQGVNATNSVPKEADFYRTLHYPQHSILPDSLTIRKPKTKKKEFAIPLPKQYIFVPFQVAYDTQIIHHSPWISDMFALFEIIKWLSTQLNIDFVVKEHPSDKSSNYVSLHHQKNPKIHFSSEVTQTLIENADAILTINSSVAMESLLFSKRVIVLGEAFFAIDGIVKTVKNKEEILRILNTIATWEIDTTLTQNFLKYLYYDYLICGNWRTPDTKHFEAIDTKLKEHLC